jgi:hypothetical protein
MVRTSNIWFKNDESQKINTINTGLLGCDGMQFGGWLSTFWSNMQED